jgi:hypothetical protein
MIWIKMKGVGHEVNTLQLYRKKHWDNLTMDLNALFLYRETVGIKFSFVE